MGTEPRTGRKRILIPLLAACWRTRDGKARDKVLKEDLVTVRCVDLELEAQYKDVRRQLNEYDRSREPEVRGKWNKVCGECGYINHERHRFCESCGCTLVVETVEIVHVCPKCGTELGKHSQECTHCGARFWSPIIQRRVPDGAHRGDDE
jgi:hypothetical protein